MNVEQVNQILANIADDYENYTPVGTTFGRIIPYLGFFWRDVSPDDLTLGLKDGVVWIMQSNKWDYPMYWCSDQERLEIYQRLEAIAENPTQEGIQAFYDYLQTYAEKMPA